MHIVIICVAVTVVALFGAWILPGQGAGPEGDLEASAPDLPLTPGPTPGAPEFLVGQSATRILAPTPTPVPSPTPRPPAWPEWVQARRDTTLRSQEDSSSRAGRPVPQGSPLKVVSGLDRRLQVRYGGDGDERRPAEGWVDAEEVSPSPAPRWVVARQGFGLRSAGGPSGDISAWLLGRTVLEVLEDLGRELRVFYPGDGRGRDAGEGWVETRDLVAAGAMLAAEGRGVRLLGRPEVASLRSGNGLWLKIPYRSQLDGSPSAGANCGPTSTGMVLESFGITVPTADLRALANKLQGTQDPESGVAIEHLQAMVERYGLRGEDLYAGRGFKRWSLDDVRRHLAMGHPVVPELRFRLMPGRARSGYYDHYVVLSGVVGDDFIYNDSVDSDGPGYARLMSAETLQRSWGGSEFPFAAFAVARP